MGGRVTVFLCGDVMLGRGVDQILPCPGDPVVRESSVRDARDYVTLAEAESGPIEPPVPFDWPWGDALPLMSAADARVINLETSVTRGGDFAPGKAVHYRMNPANMPCLAAARPDVCVLANNHVLDFGERGLRETLGSLAAAGLQAAGAGRDADEAARPAVVPLPGGRRLLVFALGMPSSGVPLSWAAGERRPGVNVLREPSRFAARALAERVRQARGPGDLVVVSVHWGSNWGYGVPPEQVEFARELIDGGVCVVHGHSSHHPRPAELYRDGLILYGCGDFVDDYEGIPGWERYRPELRLGYLVTVEAGSGRVVEAVAAPLRAERMRLRRVSAEDAGWMRTTLDRIGRDFGVRAEPRPDGLLALRER
ncbi:CapA family protein [Thermostaphylospora chromogena]|uniref:Poly-gamma-glutamate synthesis protein (Capsule biosynthesis protein) n=1 Tax=Thermostaphylospora chromogena TaxID=35622 RepID=A0A1H1GSQ7_9ACTN|nr:CapA family protein [Thermostaphylospora chromogena]SDR16225.1 poly-gamma-glutamate synthesis protein (capsule biosynthesis protein) [Thermostaphylospora chromogena]